MTTTQMLMILKYFSYSEKQKVTTSTNTIANAYQ